MYQLLKIVKFERNLNSLKRLGMSYKAIAEFSEFAAKEDYIVLNDEGISLTKKGEEHYSRLEKVNKRVNKDQWIEREEDSRIAQMDPNEIYLPNQRTIVE